MSDQPSKPTVGQTVGVAAVAAEAKKQEVRSEISGSPLTSCLIAFAIGFIIAIAVSAAF